MTIPRLGSPYANFEFVAEPPAGIAMAVAMLSDRPVQVVDLPDAPPPAFAPAETLKYVRDQARTLRVPSHDGNLEQPAWSIDEVNAGKVDIGDVSRDPIVGVDPHGLVFTKIARDGVCMITNPSNPISNLSQEEVKSIFTGNVRDWSEVPGAKISGSIDLVDRVASSGTQDAFQNIFLGEGLKISPSAEAEESNGLVQNKVKTDPNAIGFVSFAFTAGVNAVGYQGIPCTLPNAKSGQYQGVRNFWMVTKGAPKGAASKFIAWITSGNKTTKKIIASQWIPIH